ncbi:FAD-dependent oxidoreductase [Pelagimonas sp. KU-00592-HH]|uniref:NAD(P)/FAD-dependent oxidoreductase n=1 Tax=Pelagimonas sp. KU-00592-HH TaxID=3127651 RepID=UPI00310B0F6A
MQHENERSIVVIGAGQAGFSCCAKLRSLGHVGAITLVGDEGELPYQRPPLSKAYMLGKLAKERLYLRQPEFYDDENITLRLDTGAKAIDRAARQVTLNDGEILNYDLLVLATGARPITLNEQMGGALRGVHYMRNIADADRLAHQMMSGRSIVVVGGGYIGLEAAAVASESGMQVTLIEAADRILQRVAAQETSSHFRDLHRAHGIEIREGAKLDQLSGADGAVATAELSDGSQIATDLVLVGIGVRPNIDLATDAGLDIENGIRVDEYCRTSDPYIFAVGDCASFPHGADRIRLESVGNAIEQAEAAARVIVEGSMPYEAKPWFWSDQFDVKLQIAGLSTGYDQVVKRQLSEKVVSFWYFAGAQLLAVDAANDPRAYMVAKRLIDAGGTVQSSLVADPDFDLKTLVKRA